MIQFFLLMPLLMSGIWWWYLNNKGFSAKDGIRGFAYIFAFNAVIIGFFFMMMVLTH